MIVYYLNLIEQIGDKFERGYGERKLKFSRRFANLFLSLSQVTVLAYSCTSATAGFLN